MNRVPLYVYTPSSDPRPYEFKATSPSPSRSVIPEPITVQTDGFGCAHVKASFFRAIGWKTGTVTPVISTVTDAAGLAAAHTMLNGLGLPQDKWREVIVERVIDNEQFAVVDAEPLDLSDEATDRLLADVLDDPDHVIELISGATRAELRTGELDFGREDIVGVVNPVGWPKDDSDLDDAGIVALRKLAKPHKIKGAWTMKSDVLRAAIWEARRG